MYKYNEEVIKRKKDIEKKQKQKEISIELKRLNKYIQFVIYYIIL